MSEVLASSSGRPAPGTSRRGFARTHGRKLLETIGENTRTMPPAEWKVAGQSVPKVDGRAFVTGRHRYTTDQERPGMLRGKILRPPSFGAQLATLDTSRAEAMPDVKVVRDGDFVGVVAPTETAASSALAAIRPTWTPADGPASSDRDLASFLKGHPEQRSQGFGNRSAGENGSVKDELAAARVKVEAVYTVAYIAHAPLEPRAAVAEWDGHCTGGSRSVSLPVGFGLNKGPGQPAFELIRFLSCPFVKSPTRLDAEVALCHLP